MVLLSPPATIGEDKPCPLSVCAIKALHIEVGQFFLVKQERQNSWRASFKLTFVACTPHRLRTDGGQIETFAEIFVRQTFVKFDFIEGCICSVIEFQHN